VRHEQCVMHALWPPPIAALCRPVQIWGLDFGDCHKSLFAHGDSVMQVAFAPNTHYVFTVGKDRLLKYWDADRFEQLLSLDGHHGEVRSLLAGGCCDCSPHNSR